MSGVKHLLDEVAARMEIDDPNDPRVGAEVERLLSIKQRRLIMLESHPNMGGFWVGRIGTERDIAEYLKDVESRRLLDYAFLILELREGAKNEVDDWIEFDEGEPIELKKFPPAGKLSMKGTPPLPGLEKRLSGIRCSAYGQDRSVWSILQACTDEQVAKVGNCLLEVALQGGWELPKVEV